MRRPLHLPEPTPEALRMAWARMTSPARPATLEAALEHPVWGICLRAAARDLTAATYWPQVHPHPAHSTGHNTLAIRPHRAAVDLKRRAANDLDD